MGHDSVLVLIYSPELLPRCNGNPVIGSVVRFDFAFRFPRSPSIFPALPLSPSIHAPVSPGLVHDQNRSTRSNHHPSQVASHVEQPSRSHLSFSYRTDPRDCSRFGTWDTRQTRGGSGRHNLSHRLLPPSDHEPIVHPTTEHTPSLFSHHPDCCNSLHWKRVSFSSNG